MKLTFESLKDITANTAAIRRVRRLLPAGGPGDKILPPTYPREGNASAKHVFETRRMNGQDIRCVLIDSVQSQANRLEEALLRLIRGGRVKIPHMVVDFSGQTANGIDLSDLGAITSLEAPHRVFDAIIRDSEWRGKRFTESEHYKQLLLAKPTNALKLFELGPTSLVFGAWNSTGEGGGLGAKFTRCIVSEIIGVGAVEGEKTSSRIDPLGIRASVKIVGGPLDWKLATGAKSEKTGKPSDINHSNIRPSVVPGGAAIDYALHTVVITCAGLRRLRFQGVTNEPAGHAVLAALALLALTGQDASGYALRSRCDLVCDGQAPLQVVQRDGSTVDVELDIAGAIDLLEECVEGARKSGFPWNDEPITLTPQPRLVELVVKSRAKALVGESEATEKNN